MNQASETIREDQNATIRETRDSNATIREGQSTSRAGTFGVGGSFRDYRIVRQLPSTSTEADIFVIEKGGIEYILKLYRYGIEPKNDILQSIKTLSETYPQNFIHVYEADFDKGSSRWFEVQEYAKFGTLQALIDDRSKLTDTQKSLFFNDVARGVGEALNLLHQNNLLHLDIKPSNILLRSMDPLNMVLIDFGIATSLASDMSKKFTQTRGTPMYQSPESYTGGMGRASDWWGLGMILLEIANGSHPFKGLSSNVIAYSVATEPVNIPETLDAGQRELLHGLLTRNPDKRWNWEQLSKWLDGERGIPQFFEETNAEENNVTPINLMGQQYHTPSELAAAFAKDEEAWGKGRAALMRGEVSTWARNTKQMDLYAYLMEELSKTQDADERTCLFVQHFGKNLPFVFGGHQITLQNLLLFTGRALKRETISDMEQKIVDYVSDGHLLTYLDTYSLKDSDEMKVLQTALGKFRDKPLQEIVGLMDLYVNPKNYYCPFIKDGATSQDIVLGFSDLPKLPMTSEAWNRADADFVIPTDIIKDTQKVSSYFDGISSLETLIKNQQLVSRKGYNDEEVESLRPIVASLSDEQKQPKFLDFYVRPQKYYCPFVKDASTPESVVSASSTLQNPPMKIEAWEELNSKYILPKEIVEELSASADSYEKACEQIKVMESGKKLLIRDANPEKEALASVSMNEYLDGVYRLQWGYDETIIDKSLEKFNKQVYSAVGFKKAKIQLWIDYLSILARGLVSLSDDDRKILMDVQINKTETNDAVCSRLQVFPHTLHSGNTDMSFISLNQMIDSIRFTVRQYQTAKQEHIKKNRRAMKIGLGILGALILFIAVYVFSLVSVHNNGAYREGKRLEDHIKATELSTIQSKWDKVWKEEKAKGDELRARYLAEERAEQAKEGLEKWENVISIAKRNGFRDYWTIPWHDRSKEHGMIIVKEEFAFDSFLDRTSKSRRKLVVYNGGYGNIEISIQWLEKPYFFGDEVVLKQLSERSIKDYSVDGIFGMFEGEQLLHDDAMQLRNFLTDIKNELSREEEKHKRQQDRKEKLDADLASKEEEIQEKQKAEEEILANGNREITLGSTRKAELNKIKDVAKEHGFNVWENDFLIVSEGFPFNRFYDRWFRRFRVMIVNDDGVEWREVPILFGASVVRAKLAYAEISKMSQKEISDLFEFNLLPKDSQERIKGFLDDLSMLGKN